MIVKISKLQNFYKEKIRYGYMWTVTSAQNLALIFSCGL